MWRLSKSAIPCSLATRVNGHVNPKLMRSIRIWQWRCQSSKENVLEKTGRMLQKRIESWKRKKNPASFQHKSPCKLQANMLKPLDFPWENSMIFEMKINSFAMAKTTFFSKTLKKTGAVFPPTGCLCLRPENWPSVFAFTFFRTISGLGGVAGVGGGLTSLVFVRYDLRSDRLLYFVHLCHVTLFSTSWGGGGVGWGYWRPWSSSVTTCVLIVFSTLFSHIMWGWIRLLYFVAHTFMLRWIRFLYLVAHTFMLRWIRLLYFVAQTSM